MSSLRRFTCAISVALALCVPALAAAMDLSVVDADASVLRDHGEGVEVTLHLSVAVPWRVFTVDAPRRLVLDLDGAQWPLALPDETDRAGPAELTAFGSDWSRMVVPLDGPFAIDAAAMHLNDGEGARLTVRLAPMRPEVFADRSGIPDGAGPVAATVEQFATDPSHETIRVVLDPGHGGFDPGAEAGGLIEADLMLTFARELRAILKRDGGFDVALTRDDDSFVSLADRISAARSFEADVFLSLHADALPEDAGHASGATVYTLSKAASDVASQRLAERHDKDDLIAGLDLGAQTEEVALVLMDLARHETGPRSLVLAEMLLAHISAGTGHVSGRPQRMADFSVLRAPDFPSVLLELGFLSEKADRERLADPAWRDQTAHLIRDALRDWSEDDRLRRDQMESK